MTQKNKKKKKNEWESWQCMFNRAETLLHQLPWSWYCSSLQPMFQNKHDETLLISSCFSNSKNMSCHEAERTAKLNLDSINHRIIEYPELEAPQKDHQSPAPTPVSLMPWGTRTTLLPLSDKNLGWAQLPVLWNTTTFPLSDQCQPGFSKHGKPVVLPPTGPLPVLTRQITVWGCPDLPTDLPFLLCPVWGYTSMPSHSPSHTLVVMQGCVPEAGAYWITLLWTSGLWNHSTDRGANSKWQHCMAVLTAPL